jgi:lipoprotein signal peptidase
MDSVCNPESAWGLINNQTAIRTGSILMLLIILYLGYNAKNWIARFGWALIFIGGAGNLSERFAYGCVTDYWKPIAWYPAFNAQDVLIVAGSIFVVFAYIGKFKIKREKLK